MQNKQRYGMVRILKEHGIKCRHHKRFKVTTTQNFLDQKSDTNQPNKAWVSDIT